MACGPFVVLPKHLLHFFLFILPPLPLPCPISSTCERANPQFPFLCPVFFTGAPNTWVGVDADGPSGPATSCGTVLKGMQCGVQGERQRSLECWAVGGGAG